MNLDILQKLSDICGVSGNESEVREFIKSQIDKHVDKITVDTLGNLITYKKGKKKTPRVMLCAHMDEVGLMVTHIEKNGYIKFDTVGGIDARVLPAKHVLVGKDKIAGVIGFKPIHLIYRYERDELKKAPKIENLYIDIGATSEDDAKKSVKPGDYVCFATKFEANGDILKGKAFDDRIGCYILIELLKEKYDFSLYGVFTVQEETGLRGARVAGYRIEPQIALAIEGTPANDFPTKKDYGKAPEMRKGPVITIIDKTMIADKSIVELLSNTAEENKIPFQYKRPNVGGTDAGAIHITKEGCKAGVVAVASRYVHSPVCFASASDVENSLLLLKHTLKNLEDNKWKI